MLEHGAVIHNSKILFELISNNQNNPNILICLHHLSIQLKQIQNIKGAEEKSSGSDTTLLEKVEENYQEIMSGIRLEKIGNVLDQVFGRHIVEDFEDSPLRTVSFFRPKNDIDALSTDENASLIQSKSKYNQIVLLCNEPIAAS